MSYIVHYNDYIMHLYFHFFLYEISDNISYLTSMMYDMNYTFYYSEVLLTLYLLSYALEAYCHIVCL